MKLFLNIFHILKVNTTFATALEEKRKSMFDVQLERTTDNVNLKVSNQASKKKFIERKRSEGKRKIKKKAYNGEFDPGSG